MELGSKWQAWIMSHLCLWPLHVVKRWEKSICKVVQGDEGFSVYARIHQISASRNLIMWGQNQACWNYKYIVFLFFFFNVYLFLRQRETEHEQGRRREREGDTESETGSRLWAVSTEPDAGLELTDREIMTWAKVGRLTDWATQAPLYSCFQP